MSTNCTNHSVPHSTEIARARLGGLVGAVYRQWRRQMDACFKDLALSDATRLPLVVLYLQGPALLQKELAQALHLETSSLVRVLEQLRRQGLLDWASDPQDRRTKRIALTDVGRSVAAEIVAKSAEIESAILADVSPQELAVTRSVLERVVRRFSELPSAR